MSTNRYLDEFKIEAVRLVVDRGFPVAEFENSRASTGFMGAKGGGNAKEIAKVSSLTAPKSKPGYTVAKQTASEGVNTK